MRATANRALIFPGQGSQRVGMATRTNLVERASQILHGQLTDCGKRSLVDIIQGGPMSLLTRSSIAQPAILATSLQLAADYSLNPKDFKVIMGHSLGEWTALTFAGCIEFDDAIRLVHRRGLAMEQCTTNRSAYDSLAAGHSFMLACLLLPRSPEENFDIRRLEIARILEQINVHANVNGHVQVGNWNSRKQMVLTGSDSGILKKAVDELKLKRLVSRAMPLPVSAPFHSGPLMGPAVDQMRPLIEQMEIRLLSHDSPLILGNIDGQPHNALSESEIKERLLQQISAPVEWKRSVEYCLSQLSINGWTFMGPGDQLANLFRRDLSDKEAGDLQITNLL